jgi:hypothetical protein
MPRQCLFCEQNAGNQEHLWADWILKLRKWGPIRHSIGGSPEKILGSGKQTVGTVCRTCNNGWMSGLEAENIPLMGSLLHDISAPLDAAQQSLLSAWTMKTAMVFDSVNRRTRTSFYERDECKNLRLTRSIPDRVHIWMGRSSISTGLAAIGTDLSIVMSDGLQVGMGCATTLVVGHLALQVLAMHIFSEHTDKNIGEINPKPGRWNEMLSTIWPIGGRSVAWPPPVTFTNSGESSIATLMDRWRLGVNTGVFPSAGQ